LIAEEVVESCVGGAILLEPVYVIRIDVVIVYSVINTCEVI
jgi:hypothetical protein